MDNDLQKLAAARMLLNMVQGKRGFNKTAGIRDSLIKMLGGRPARSAGSVLKPLLTALGLGGAGYLGYQHRDELEDLLGQLTKRLGIGAGSSGGGLPEQTGDDYARTKSKIRMERPDFGRGQPGPNIAKDKGLELQRALEKQYGIDLSSMAEEAQTSIDKELDQLSSNIMSRARAGALGSDNGVSAEQQQLLYKAWRDFLQQNPGAGPSGATPRGSSRSSSTQSGRLSSPDLLLP